MKFIICLAFVSLAAVALAQESQEPNCPEGLPELFAKSKQECFKEHKEQFDNYQQATVEEQEAMKESFISCLQTKMETDATVKTVVDDCEKEVTAGATAAEAKEQQFKCIHKELTALCPKTFAGQ